MEDHRPGYLAEIRLCGGQERQRDPADSLGSDSVAQHQCQREAGCKSREDGVASQMAKSPTDKPNRDSNARDQQCGVIPVTREQPIDADKRIDYDPLSLAWLCESERHPEGGKDEHRAYAESNPVDHRRRDVVHQIHAAQHNGQSELVDTYQHAESEDIAQIQAALGRRKRRQGSAGQHRDRGIGPADAVTTCKRRIEDG